MKPYKKKPLIIQAIKVSDYGQDGLRRILRRAGARVYEAYEDDSILMLTTLEGQVPINMNEYVIKGIKGEFYTCRADIFEESYETPIS